MQRHARQHRYPKKRNILRILLLMALPVLLIFLLIGTSLILTDNEPDTAPMLPQRPDLLKDLPPEEAYPQGPLPASLSFDKLVLEKGRRRLTAYAKGGPVRVYLVALGENAVGHKGYEGDRRTPEGVYAINDKNPDSAYYKNMGISYPNEKDRAHARSLGRHPGGDIKIHGLAREFADIGKFHRLTDWTFGCVAVTNEEMEELFRHTPVDTPIEILP